MGVEFHLTRTVKQEVRVCVLLELAFQPVQVGLHILQAVEEPTVGPQLQALHHIIQSDQLGDVHRTRIGQSVIGRVHVHHHHLSTEPSEKVLHPPAVGGLPGARGPDDDLAEAERRRRSPLHGAESSRRSAADRGTVTVRNVLAEAND